MAGLSKMHSRCPDVDFWKTRNLKKNTIFQIFFRLWAKNWSNWSEKFSTGESKLFEMCQDEFFCFDFFLEYYHVPAALANHRKNKSTYWGKDFGFLFRIIEKKNEEFYYWGISMEKLRPPERQNFFPGKQSINYCFPVEKPVAFYAKYLYWYFVF